MTIAEELVQCLKEKKLHIATAESCTGGLVASSLVDVAGASEVFEEGYITYSDFVKAKNLGVSPETLKKYTAVSCPAAEEMAGGAAKKSRAEVAVSVTGYAGPDAAEDGTPAGTVYIGVYYMEHVQGYHFRFEGDRGEVRRQAAQEALSLVLDTVR